MAIKGKVMKLKNSPFLRIFVAMCVTAFTFQSLLPTYQGRRPAGKRPAGYTGPKRQTPVRTQKTLPQPAPEQEKIEPIVIEKELPETEEDLTKQAETDTTATASTKETQITAPTPGFLTKMYAVATPLILVTLNAAVGIAIEAGTKSLLKGFGKRPELLEKKEKVEENVEQLELQLLTKYPDIIEQKKFDLIPEKERTALAENYELLEALTKTTSISHIFGKAAYTLMLYTIINSIAKFTGYGATMTLQSMMPEQK